MIKSDWGSCIEQIKYMNIWVMGGVIYRISNEEMDIALLFI